MRDRKKYAAVSFIGAIIFIMILIIALLFAAGYLDGGQNRVEPINIWGK